MRILKELSLSVAQESESISNNYRQLVLLDRFNAKALFCERLKAGPVKIVEHTGFSLVKAHHPLLYFMEPQSSRCNTVALKGEQKTLVISGPNAGGKSVILKTIALTQTMVSAGLPVPCHESSEVYLLRTFILNWEILKASMITYPVFLGT